MSQAIILCDYMQIGDRVRYQAGQSTLEYDSLSRMPDGTLGTVVGFYRYLDYVDVNDGWTGLSPGVYEGNGQAYVHWDVPYNNEQSRPSAHDLYFEDSSLNALRREDKQRIEAHRVKVRLRDLPKLPYMVGDEVLVLPKYFDGEPVVIESIDYRNLTEKRCDGSPMPIYRITDLERKRGSTCVEQLDVLALHRRGNFWAWLHDKNSLRFSSLNEEISFYSKLGLTEQIVNPKRDDYSWDISDALQAVLDGVGHFVETSRGLFGARPFPTVHRFKETADMDLSGLIARCREKVEL